MERGRPPHAGRPPEASVPGGTPSPASTPRRRPGWRALAALVLGLIVIWLALRVPAAGTFVANLILGRIAPVPRASIRVAEVRGDWLTRMDLRGLRIARGDTTLVSADTLRLRVRPLALLAGRIDLEALEAGGVRVSQRMFETPGAQTAPRGPSGAELLRGGFYRGPAVRVGWLAVRGARYLAADSAAAGARTLAEGSLHAHDIALGGGFACVLDSAVVRFAVPDPAGLHADAGVRGRLADGRLELEDLWITSVRSRVDADGVLEAGAGDSLRNLRVTARAAPFALSDLALVLGTADRGPAEFDGDLSLDVALEGSGPAQFSGRLNAETDRALVAGVRLGPSRLDATMDRGAAEARLRARVEGADVRIDGSGRPLDPHPTWALDATLPGLPKRLPGVPWWTDLASRIALTTEIHARGQGYGGAKVDVEGSASGDAGTLDLSAHLDLSRGMAWEVKRFAFTDLDLAAWSGDTTAGRIFGELSARGRTGAGAPDQAVARLLLRPSEFGTVTLSSGELRVRREGPRFGASAELSLAGGVVQVDTLTWRMDGISPFRLEGGRIRGLDPARLVGHAAPSGSLNVDFDADGAGVASLGGPEGAQAALRDGRVSGRVTMRIAPTHWRDRTIQAGRVEATLRGGAVAVEARATSDAGRFEVLGSARPFGVAPSWRIEQARFEDLDAGAWSGSSGWSTALNGSIRGEGGTDADGMAASSLAVRLERSRAGGLRIDGADVEGILKDGRGRLHGTVHARGTALELDVNAARADSGTAGQGRVDVPLTLLAGLAAGDSAGGEGRIRLDATFRVPDADASAAEARGTVVGSGRVGRARLDSLGLAFRFERGALDVDTLVLRSDAVQASARGRLALIEGGEAAPESDLRGRIDVVDPAPLAALLGADSLGIGSGSASFEVEGPARARRVTLRTALYGLVWNGVRFARLEGDADGVLDVGWGMRSGRASLEAEHVLSGGLDFQRLHAAARYDGTLLRFSGGSLRDERHRLRVAGSIESDSTGRDVRFDTLSVDSDSSHWALARPGRMHIGSDTFALENLEMRSADGRLTANGVVDRRGDQSLRIELDGVGLDLISVWLGRTDLGGRLDGSFALSGPATSPRGEGTLFVRMSADGRPAGVLRSRLLWDGRGLDVGGAYTAARGDSLSLEGRLPLALSIAAQDSDSGRVALRVFDGDVSVRVHADAFPLKALVPLLGAEHVLPVEGTLRMDARLQGTSARLAGTGGIEVRDGVIDLPGLGVRFRDTHLEAAFDGDRIVLRDCRARSAKGRIEAQGNLRVARLTRVEPDITVRAERGLFVDRRDLRVVASGEVRFGGTLADPVVQGRARVEDSHVLIDDTAADVSQTRREVELSPADMRMLQEHFTRVDPAAPDPAVALFDAMDLDLSVTLDRNTWVRQETSPKLSVELTGDVDVRKRPHGELQLFGRIEPIPGRGFVEQFGRSFDIAGGEVLLNGRMEDHTVDVRTTYRARSQAPSSAESDVVVHLDVQGTTDDLSLTLSSEPSLSETEIVTYIATGRDPTAAQAGTSTSRSDATALARDIGLSQVSSALESAARSRIGLDVLQLRFDALQGATLVAGRYLDPSLYVGFRQPLQSQETGGSSAGQELRTRVELEYEAYRWLVLNLQGETSLLRSFIRVRHAY